MKYCGHAVMMAPRYVHSRHVHQQTLVDRCDPVQVESAPCRATAGPLTYVVAFANGGAKDVTQRYVSSFMTTEKLRCGAWWDATLAPLRRLQLAGVWVLLTVIECSI